MYARMFGSGAHNKVLTAGQRLAGAQLPSRLGRARPLRLQDSFHTTPLDSREPSVDDDQRRLIGRPSANSASAERRSRLEANPMKLYYLCPDYTRNAGISESSTATWTC